MREQKNASIITHKFYCEHCDYGCSKLGDYNRHLSTLKHLKRTGQEHKNASKSIKVYVCDCGKEYKSRSAHWSHKKKCTFIPPIKESDDALKIKKLEETVVGMQEDNKVLMTTLLTAINDGKLGGTTNNNNVTNNTTNNNQFNLNIFLNEKCKDALNIEDFVNNIKLKLSDLDKVGQLGYVEGISNIIIRGLNELDVEKRPIHCTDSKRETLYVKDGGEWSKDNDKSKLKQAVDVVTKNNTKQFPEWIRQNPDKLHDEFLKISNCQSGGIPDSDEQDKNINRVIKKIAQASIVDKKDNI